MGLGTDAASPASAFDVFLSHNSRDKPVVERIAERLKRAGLEPWLDSWALSPGGRWQEELAAGMQASAACAYFVGPNGDGDWEREELAVALTRAAAERPFRVFPVLLPGVGEPFDRTTLPPFLSTRTWVDLRRGLDDTRAFQALVNAIKGVPLGPAVPVVARDDVCPYRGLQTFDEAHADLFFGREGDVQAILEQLKATRFLAVLGPSGSGKSSIVRAGVIPVLRREGIEGGGSWTIEVVRPGGRPLEAIAVRLQELDSSEGMQRTVDELAQDERTLHLAGTLALQRLSGSTRLIWVIDQAEELFTLGDDEAARAQAIANLVYAASVPNGPAVVILTMRADFYSRCAAYPPLSALLARHQYLVGPMDEAGLRAAVEEPARAVGLEFESGLVDTILEDVARAPGTLPLLEHALFELWERRRGGMLTLEAYRETGGVHGAIAKRAETIYEGFDASRQAIVRRALLRLTQPGEGTEDTRRRASLREVTGRAEEERPVEEVVRDLTDARLLTTSADQQTGERWVDISHEALIRGWPRLQGWLDEDRTALRVHRRITETAEEWELLGRVDDVLYRGARLAEAVEWQKVNEALLNDMEREFLQASIALAQRERAGRERLRRRLTMAAVTGSFVFLLLAAVALIQWRNADQQRQTALVRQLAAQAGNPQMRSDRALLLSVEADRRSDAAEARGSLLAALTNTRVRTYLGGVDDPVGLAFSPDGATLASGAADGGLVLWDIRTLARIAQPLRGHSAAIESVAFSPDGSLLASAGLDGAIMLWDIASGTSSGDALVGQTGGIQAVVFSPDGATLASGAGDGTVVLWDVASRTRVGAALRSGRGAVETIAFSPDGSTLAAGTFDNAVVIWDVATRARVGEPLGGHSGRVQSVAFSPDGRTLASGSDDNRIFLWDVASGAGLELPSDSGGVESVAFSPDGRTLASGNDDDTIVLWDVASRSAIEAPLRGHSGAVMKIVFSPDGTTLASGGSDDTIALWDVAGGSAISDHLQGPDNVILSIDVSPDGRTLASAADDGTISLWDVARRARSGDALRGHIGRVRSVAFSPDGRLLASGGQDGAVLLWDVASRTRSGDPLLDGGGPEVVSVAFSPDGRTLASGSFADGTIILWDVSSRTRRGKPLLGHDRITSLAFSPDGATMASGGINGSVVLWDVASGTRRGEPIRGDGHRIESLALSPDGTKLAWAGVDNTIDIWDVLTRSQVGEPLRHDDQVLGIAFSPDGTTLASAAEDGTVMLWDVATGSQIGEPLRGHDGRVLSVAFSPDGKTLGSAGFGGAIVLWRIDPQDWSATACRIANRNLTSEEWRQYLGDEPYHATCPGLPMPEVGSQGAG